MLLEFDSTAQVHMIVELCPVLQEVVNGELVGRANVPDSYMVRVGFSQEGFSSIRLQYTQKITCLTELHWLNVMACSMLKKK